MLATVLLKTPRNPRGTSAIEQIRCSKETSVRPTHRTKGKRPEGLLEAAAVSYIIGQIAKPRVSLCALSAWVELAYGIEYNPSTLALAMRRYGIKRKNTRTIPDDVLLECAQYVIIRAAHGIKQPWILVAEQLWHRHKIREAPVSLGNKCRSWMKGQRG